MSEMTITTRRAMIGLAHLISGHAQEVRGIASDCPERALLPEHLRYLPIVRQVAKEAGSVKTTSYAVVDGFHRLAGMLAAGASVFPVIVVDAPDALLRSIDADSEIGDCEQLDAIYAADKAVRS